MVVQSLEQLEKNVSASFSYVKKDLMMLNDALSDINDRIQHLSLNHAALLEKMQDISEKKYSEKKETSARRTKKLKEKLEFYDLKAKKKFKTNDYVFVTKSGRKFAVADAPSGVKSWRIVGMSISSKKITKKSKIKKTKTPKKVVKETIVY